MVSGNAPSEFTVRVQRVCVVACAAMALCLSGSACWAASEAVQPERDAAGDAVRDFSRDGGARDSEGASLDGESSDSGADPLCSACRNCAATTSHCLAECASPTITPTPVGPDGLTQAVADAIGFFDDSREPHALLMLDVMYRRFGIAAFADALQRYDEVVSERPTGQAPLLRLFRRIADHDNPLVLDDLNAVTIDIDRVTIPALYCDRLGLFREYPAMLDEAVRRGGYLRSHVLLASIWWQDNGCQVPLPEGFLEAMYRENAALIGDDPVIDDLELEAAAFLYVAGQGELVEESFVERVIAQQTDDGGWLTVSDVPGESDWHTTAAGLLLLLHVGCPADSYPPMLAPPITK
jgi:hypothetical protein